MQSVPCAWMCSANTSSCAMTISASTSRDALGAELQLLRLLAMEADSGKSAAHGVTTEAGLLCTRRRFGGVTRGVGLTQTRILSAVRREKLASAISGALLHAPRAKKHMGALCSRDHCISSCGQSTRFGPHASQSALRTRVEESALSTVTKLK